VTEFFIGAHDRNSFFDSLRQNNPVERMPVMGWQRLLQVVRIMGNSGE
jgi:hypothetical protein